MGGYYLNRKLPLRQFHMQLLAQLNLAGFLRN